MPAGIIRPVRIIEVELGQALPILSAYDEKTGQQYQLAHCLVRLHDHPLGIVELAFEKHEFTPAEYADRIWDTLGSQINDHLRLDGLSTISRLEAEGIICGQSPLCLEERAAFLATAPFVSIIVSTRDRAESLSLCLPSLLTQDYPHYEVIIVDNAPKTDETANLIQRRYADISHLRYVREERPGLSRGLNRGIDEARGEILAFTDDDVVADRYWLLQLVRAFSMTEDVACVTGLVLPLELETAAQFWFEEYGGFSKGFQQHIYDLTTHRPQEPLYPYTAGRFGTGASMAFRASLLRRVGGFDPALHAGMDIAAFFQIVSQSHRLVYEPSALVHHTHRRNYGELKKQIYNYGVGLTAYLTKIVIDNPGLLFELLGKVPYGLFFTLSTRSPKNKKKQQSYPRDLTLLELKGMLIGPFIYLRRRWELPASEKRAILRDAVQ